MIIRSKTGYDMRVTKSIPYHDPHFHIVEIGFSAPPPGLVYHHVDPELTIHFVSHGRGLFNGIPVDNTTGFLIGANEPFEYRLDKDEPWEHFWFRLGGDNVAAVLNSLGMSTESHVFEYSFIPKLIDDFEKLLSSSEDVNFDVSIYLLGLFYKTMSYYSATRPKSTETRTEAYLRIAKQFIESHYNEAITVDDIAKAANITSKYLYKIFTEKLGRSPKSYLTATRLDRARIMLERGELSVAQIARSVGYEHPNYFTASFGKLYGSSPADYRRLHHINSTSKETAMTENRTALACAMYANYHASANRSGSPTDPGRLADLIERIHQRLAGFNEIDSFPDLPYNHPNARELWFAAISGCFDDFPEGGLCPERELTDSERIAALNLLAPDFDKLAEIFAKAKSKLAKASALYLYKLSRAALSDDRYDAAQKKRISEITGDYKAKIRALGEISDVTGSLEDPINYIYRFEKGPFVREVKIKSNKPESPAVELVQVSDLHYNLCNEADLAQSNPSLMSTLEYRKWLANGSSVPAVRRALEYADASDLTIVTGDILDYLSLGGQELTVNELFRRDATLIACPGGHDITRVMQGKVPDPTTLDSRYKILESFWCNPVRYTSRVVGGKVMVIALDNDCGRYTPDQYEKLSIDLAVARKDELIVLIFQHEQMSTSNPADTNVPYIRAGDASGSFDFSPGGRFIGADCRSKETNGFYELIRSSSDVVKGIFCGHWHNDMYTEIKTPDGGVIPQYILTACPYDNAGHAIKITVE